MSIVVPAVRFVNSAVFRALFVAAIRQAVFAAQAVVVCYPASFVHTMFPPAV